MFRKGTRVIVINKEEARSVGAIVENGDIGVCTDRHVGKYSIEVCMDNGSKPDWYVPITALERTKKKAEAIK